MTGQRFQVKAMEPGGCPAPSLRAVLGRKRLSLRNRRVAQAVWR